MLQREQEISTAISQAQLGRNQEEAFRGLFSIYGGPLVNKARSQGMNPDGPLKIAIYGVGPVGAEELTALYPVFPNANFDLSDVDPLYLNFSESNWRDKIQDLQQVGIDLSRLNVSFNQRDINNPSQMPPANSQDIAIARGIIGGTVGAARIRVNPNLVIPGMLRTLRPGGLLLVTAQQTWDIDPTRNALKNFIAPADIHEMQIIPFNVIATPVSKVFVAVKR